MNKPKGKRRDPRSRFRKRKDEVMLRAFAWHQYRVARAKAAAERNVPPEQMKHKGGHTAAVNAGLRALRSWFQSAGDKQDGYRRGMEHVLSGQSTPRAQALIDKARQIQGATVVQ